MAALTDAAGVTASREAYLWETLGVLWPEPAQIERRGRAVDAASPHAELPGQAEFLVLPSAERAALLLPRRPRRAAAAALRHYKASAAGTRRLVFRALGLAARAGLADVLPDRVTIGTVRPGPEADVVSYLREALGQDLVVSLRISAPRANRKPVLQLLSPRGEILGFAKVGVTDLTGGLVRAEAAALRRLAAAPLARVAVPRLLHHGQWRGHEVLVQAPLSGSGRPGRQAGLTSAMAEVAAVAGLTTQTLGGSGYGRGLRARLEACLPSEPARELLQVLASLETRAAGTSLVFGAWHGDWTPWNMTFSAGRALVWDWERFAAGVPVGYDALHYQVQAAVAGNPAGAQAAAEVALFTAPMTLAPLGVGRGVAGLVAALYLIEIAARYLQDQAAEAGARLGDVQSWLLPPLASYAGRFQATAGHEGEVA
jgi:phosphotransferase family enzyme